MTQVFSLTYTVIITNKLDTTVIIADMKQMQEIASRVFITASVCFGIFGTILILSSDGSQDPPDWMFKVMAVTVFTILSSFGVSVGLKYLSDK